MVMIALYAKQKKRHRCTEQTFGLCERRRGWDVGGKLKREGTYVYLCLIHVDVWQKPTQYCNYPSIKSK